MNREQLEHVIRAAGSVLIDAHRFLLDHGGAVGFREKGWLRHDLERRVTECG